MRRRTVQPVAVSFLAGAVPGDRWAPSYLDEHMEKLLKDGVKRVVVVTPSFVSDCLETLFEIGLEYREQYLEAGGDNFALLLKLHDDPECFAAVYKFAVKHLGRR